MDEVAAQTKILFEKKKLLSSEPETYSLDVTFKETDVKKKIQLNFKQSNNLNRIYTT